MTSDESQKHGKLDKKLMLSSVNIMSSRSTTQLVTLSSSLKHGAIQLKVCFQPHRHLNLPILWPLILLWLFLVKQNCCYFLSVAKQRNFNLKLTSKCVIVAYVQTEKLFAKKKVINCKITTISGLQNKYLLVT